MVEFTFTPVADKGRKPSSRWDQLAQAFACTRGTLPTRFRDTSIDKAEMIIAELERDQPDLVGAFYYVGPKRTTVGHDIEIRTKDEYKKVVEVRQWGLPADQRAGPKPIQFFTPDKIAEVLSEMEAIRAAWVTAGKYAGTGRTDPFSEAARRKLLTEGKLIRTGPREALPAKHFVEEVIDNLKLRVRENYAEAIRKTFRRCLRGLI